MPTKDHSPQNNNQEQTDSFDPQSLDDELLRKESQSTDQKTRDAEASQKENPFLNWLKEDWLLKLGALFIILSIGWFIGYAVNQEWLSPEALVILGLVTGAGILGGGAWFMEKRASQGAVITLVGLLTVVLTVFTARLQLDMFNAPSALGIMFLALVVTATASIKYNVYWMSVVALIAGVILPDLTVPQSDGQYLSLFLYLFVLVLGTLWTVFITKWRSLTAIALILVSIRSAIYWIEHTLGTASAQQNDTTILAIGFALVAAFFATNVANIIQNPQDRNAVDLITAGLNGIFVFGWVVTIVPETWQGAVLALWALVFAGGAIGISSMTNDRNPIYVYGSMAIALLGVATSLQFDGDSLKIALILEITALILASFPVLRNIKLTEGLTALMLLPGVFTLQDILSSKWASDTQYWYSGFWHEDTGIKEEFVRTEEDTDFSTVNALSTIASLYFFTLVWLVTHSIHTLSEGSATGISLGVYAVVGLAIYIWGEQKQISEMQLYGGIVIGGVILRLLLVDVWEMNLVPRIGTFFTIGVIFMVTALIWKNKDSEQSNKPSNTDASQKKED